jgi:hypothetical protein
VRRTSVLCQRLQHPDLWHLRAVPQTGMTGNVTNDLP